jgi:hypothetical protein
MFRLKPNLRRICLAVGWELAQNLPQNSPDRTMFHLIGTLTGRSNSRLIIS